MVGVEEMPSTPLSALQERGSAAAVARITSSITVVLARFMHMQNSVMKLSCLLRDSSFHCQSKRPKSKTLVKFSNCCVYLHICLNILVAH